MKSLCFDLPTPAASRLLGADMASVPIKFTSQKSKSKPNGFLPMSRAEMDARGWTELDVLIITGDAYVDHPSFGAAMIGRVLE